MNFIEKYIDRKLRRISWKLTLIDNEKAYNMSTKENKNSKNPVLRKSIKRK